MFIDGALRWTLAGADVKEADYPPRRRSSFHDALLGAAVAIALLLG